VSKRIFDIILSTAGLLLLLPLMALIAVLIRLFLGSPVLFRQVRPGLRGVPFTLIKFRSMSGEFDGFGREVPESQRLGAFGRRLRRCSLDELPELWNVLRGDMSLVGPRPLLMEYLPLYSATQMRRHEVRPGLTGWAQVNGRNAISWDEKFALDVWYVDNRSMFLDIKILALTVVQVFAGKGVNQASSVTMEKFTGN